MANLKDLIVNGSARILGTIYGNLSGTASKATADASGNTITSTYATKTEVNAKATDTAVVHLTGAETISGTKTFQGSAWNNQVIVERSGADGGYVTFKGPSGVLGALGCYGANKPTFVNASGATSRIVTATNDTAIGSTTTPVYINASGVATAIGHTIATSVPSGAVFTDTKNTSGTTDTSSKIFLAGATSQAANPQTYSHDTAFVDTAGTINSATPAKTLDAAAAANLTKVNTVGLTVTMIDDICAKLDAKTTEWS